MARERVRMITILFRMTVKAERDAEWRALAAQLTRSTRSEDAGCVIYVYHRQIDPTRTRGAEAGRDSRGRGTV
jgi:quinol monooxygenase YgiN